MSCQLKLILVSIFVGLSFYAKSQKLIGYVEYGYPRIVDSYKGVFFLGYGQCFLSSDKVNLLLKPEISRYKLQKEQGVWNAELDLVGEYNFWQIESGNNLHLLYLIGELGYNSMLNSKVKNDGGSLYTIGIEYSNADIGNGRFFIHYQIQNHAGTNGETNLPMQNLALIKFGVKALIWNWRVP